MSMTCFDSVTLFVRRFLFLNHETSVAGPPRVRQEMVNSGGLTLGSECRVKFIGTQGFSCPIIASSLKMTIL